jgi:hypothetical protein
MNKTKETLGVGFHENKSLATNVADAVEFVGSTLRLWANHLKEFENPVIVKIAHDMQADAKPFLERSKKIRSLIKAKKYDALKQDIDFVRSGLPIWEKHENAIRATDSASAVVFADYLCEDAPFHLVELPDILDLHRLKAIEANN